MEKAAIEKAKRRLGAAERALQQLSEANSHDEAVDHWYALLVASKNIWTIMEQGAKPSAQARQWFGGKKRQRRSDELLQYMFEARNCDEHGLEDVIKYRPSGSRLEASFTVDAAHGFTDGCTLKSVAVDRATGEVAFSGTHADGSEFTITQPSELTLLPATSVLCAIKARDGKVIDPPKTHLGKLMENNYPVTVASLALTYQRSLIDEAEALHTP